LLLYSLVLGHLAGEIVVREGEQLRRVAAALGGSVFGVDEGEPFVGNRGGLEDQNVAGMINSVELREWSQSDTVDGLV